MTNRKKISLLIAVVIVLATALIVVIHLLTKFVFDEEAKTEAPTIEAPVKEEVGKIKQEVIGTSIEGRAIESYTFGHGSTTLLFVGGIHGGYEWNSVLLAYAMIDDLVAKNITIPDGLSVVIIPSLNPYGVYLTLF